MCFFYLKNFFYLFCMVSYKKSLVIIILTNLSLCVFFLTEEIMITCYKCVIFINIKFL